MGFSGAAATGSGLGRHGSRSRWRRLGCRLFLQFGKTLIFELDQLLQVGNVLFERPQTLVGFSERFFLGDLIFFAALRRTRFGAPLARRNLELILGLGGRRRFVLDLGGDLAGRIPALAAASLTGVCAAIPASLLR